MDHFEEEAAAVWCGRDKGTKRKTTTIIIFITYGAKLLNVDLKQRALFLITRALLVIRRAWLLDTDWLSTPALSWFPASNGILKRNFRIGSLLSLIQTQLSHRNVKWNRHAAKLSHLKEKQNNFSTQKCVDIDSQPDNSLSEDGWCRTKHGVTEIRGCQTES